MTYDELFELCNRSIGNRSNFATDLRAAYSETDARVKSRLLDYLNAETEVARAKRNLYQGSWEIQVAKEAYYDELGEVPFEFYRGEASRLQRKALEAVDEGRRRLEVFSETYARAVQLEQAANHALHDAGIRFDPVFQKHTGLKERRVQIGRERLQRVRSGLNQEMGRTGN